MLKLYEIKVFTKHDLKSCTLCQTLSHIKFVNLCVSKEQALELNVLRSANFYNVHGAGEKIQSQIGAV